MKKHPSGHLFLLQKIFGDKRLRNLCLGIKVNHGQKISCP